jgi:Fe2+ or Zn2+ uptake regulation protein
MDAEPPGGHDTGRSLAAEWLARLQQSGHRQTAPLRAIVEVLTDGQRVLYPLQVFEQARARYPRLGLVTVYRTFDKLAELGLLQRVHQPSGCQGFVVASNGHQHLLICQECGRVAYFDGEADQVDSLVRVVERNSGYHVSDHWLQLFGSCEDCQRS